MAPRRPDRRLTVEDVSLRAALACLEGQPAALATDRLGHAIRAARQRQRISAAGDVAVIPLFGLIDRRESMMTRFFGGTGLDSFMASVRSAMVAPSVESILLIVDSPGGGVYGVTEAASLVAEAAKKKRVVATADSLMASAAYWIASAASELVVTPSGEVGSIGVYTVHFDWSKNLGGRGIAPTIVRYPDQKAEGNPYEPMSDEAQAHTLSIVQAYGRAFEKAVAKGRGVSISTVRQQFGGGRTYDAARAVQRGLADRIATLDDVLQELQGGGSRPAGRAAAAPSRIAAVVEQEPAGVPWALAWRLADASTWQRARMVAYHEAGHAVAMLRLHQTLSGAEIRWRVDGGRLLINGGRVHGGLPPEDTSADACATVCAAGIAAELEAGFQLLDSAFNRGGDPPHPGAAGPRRRRRRRDPRGAVVAAQGMERRNGGGPGSPRPRRIER